MWTTFDLKANHEIYKVPYLKKNKENAVVIGAGPAGLSCALELHFLGFNVCVFEKRNYIERYLIQ
jgi:ribulose 1,5-bisphosphate synthetase/thiazole synthase